MKAGKPIAFVVLAFLVGGIAPQLPFAFADSSANPLQALWDAIGALSSKQESLQVQIDELRAQIQEDNQVSAEASNEILPQSETSIKIGVGSDDDGNSRSAISDNEVIFNLMASNSGPDKAVGVKLTFFYKLGLFDIQSITAEDGQQCEKPSRGIIQCYIGTIDPETEHQITITALADMPDQEAHIVADVSSITQDTDLGNNHSDLTFVPDEILAETSSDSNTVNSGQSESGSESPKSQSSSHDSEEGSALSDAEKPDDDAQQDQVENGTNDDNNNTGEETTQGDAGDEPQSNEENSESQSSGSDTSNNDETQEQEQQQDSDTSSNSSESSEQDDESSSQDEGGNDASVDQ